MGNATGIPWKRILVEFLAIFAGVFLGLFADQWWQERHQRHQERVVLMDMLQELEEEAPDMRSVLRQARAWSEAGLWVTQNVGADIGGRSAWSALSPLFFRSSYFPRSAAYVSLRDAGQLELIADQALRQQVAAYFETNQQDTYSHHLRTLAVYDELVRVAREHFAWRLFRTMRRHS